MKPKRKGKKKIHVKGFMSGTTSITDTKGRILYKGSPSSISSIFHEYLQTMPKERAAGLRNNLPIGFVDLWFVITVFPVRLPKAIAIDFEAWLVMSSLAEIGES